jgi:DNA-binding CsgD family transcriptional regulator
LYLSINQTDSAETYFKKQLEESYKMNDYIAKASSINNLGITKITKKDYLNALKLFDKSLEFLDNYNKKISEYFENERESFRKSILSNIIESHYHLKNYKKVDYFYKIFCNNNIKKFPSLELKSIVLDAYIKLNNIEQINKIIAEIRPFENQFTSGNNLIYLKMLLNYAQYKNDLKDIKLLIKKIDLLEKEVQQDEKIKNDKMNNIVSHFLITQATEKINFEKKQKNQLKQEIKLKQQKQSLLTSTIIFIIIGFTLFLFIIYQLNRNKRKKSDLEKQFLLLEEDKMKHKIKVQENILTDLSIEKRIRDTNNREILKNLSYLKRCEESKIKQEIHQLILNINNNDIHHIDHDALKGVSEEYIIHFKIKLLEQNPKLSDADINLCLLIKLNFSNKAIAEYKNITYSSVKIFKNRLKKKLSLNSESSLSEYIHNLN